MLDDKEWACESTLLSWYGTWYVQSEIGVRKGELMAKKQVPLRLNEKL